MSPTQDYERRLSRLLVGSRFGEVRWVDETGSTNADLLGLAADPMTPEQALITDYQSAGRGRRDRQWESAPHSALMMSILIRPNGPLTTAHRYTAALGLAARDACEEVVDVRPRLKWPNDLVFGNRKLAGILAESAMERDQFVGLVAGIGINVLADGGWSEEVRARATSLAAESVDTPEIDRVQLAAALLRRLEHWCDAEPGDLLEEHLRHSSTVGSQVRVERERPVAAGAAPEVESLVGEAVGIDLDGRLQVRDAMGVMHELSVGDVTHLRRV